MGKATLIARLERSLHVMRQRQSAARESDRRAWSLGQAAATYGDTADSLQAAIDWLSQPDTEQDGLVPGKDER